MVMLLLVAELALATIALTTLSYITTASPEGHEEQMLTPPVEHQVEDSKPAPLPTTTEAMTDVGTWSSPDPATAVELARQLNAAEAKLAVREAELATERAARAAAERMAASALVAAAENRKGGGAAGNHLFDCVQDCQRRQRWQRQQRRQRLWEPRPALVRA